MTATQIRQEAATEIAAERGYRVEVHQQAGDCWDVRIYGTTTNGYNRKRDVAKANIGDAIMRMLDELPPETADAPAAPAPTNSFAVAVLRALNTKRATVAQLQTARTMLAAEHESLTETDRDGDEGRAYALAIQTILVELTARGH
jgi:hypothetical protein